MKPVLSLLTTICLVVPATGQTADPAINDPTVVALTALLPLKQQAKFGVFLRGNHERTKFAGFLDAQGRFALLANKDTLLHVKAEADRPNYGGNAAARTRNNLWQAIIEGRAVPSPSMPSKSKD
jgi:hypothetical protein